MHCGKQNYLKLSDYFCLVSSTRAQVFLDRFSPLAYPMRHAYWFLIEISFKQKVASIPQPSLKISEVSPKHPRLVAFPKPSNVIVDINSEISAPNFNILISRCLAC